MISLLITIKRKDKYLDMVYYDITKSWSDGDFTIKQKGYVNLQDMLMDLFHDLDVYESLNQITVIVSSDDELKHKLKIITGSIKDPKTTRSSLFKQEFPDALARDKYKAMLNNHYITIM
jgi:hypothetical protein